MKDFRDLDVWQRSVDLAVEAHKVALRLPAEEKYGLASQLRRASVSVSANIAEGYGRDSRAEFMRFLRIARGSVSEVMSIAAVIERTGYLHVSVLESLTTLCDRIRAMLTRLVAAIARSAPR